MCPKLKDANNNNSYTQFNVSKIGRGYYLYQSYKNNGRWSSKYIRPLGFTEPVFYTPKILEGYCENFIREMPADSIDLILDDPPYGITRNNWDIEPEWEKIADVYNHVLKDNGLIYIFGRQPMLSNVMYAFKKYFDFRFELIWNKKNNPWVSNYMPTPIHENIFVFKKKKCPVEQTKFFIERIKGKGKPYKKHRKPENKSSTHNKYKNEYLTINNGWRFPKSVLEITSVNGNNKEYCGFSTQKPFSLLEWIISASSNPGDLILDPHSGSGSTCLSAYQMCRKSIGIELNPDNFQLINSRLSKIKLPQKYTNKNW